MKICFYEAPDGQSDITLTGEEEAGLSDKDLIEAAVSEAYRAGIVSKEGDDPAKMCGNRLSEAELRSGLKIVED